MADFGLVQYLKYLDTYRNLSAAGSGNDKKIKYEKLNIEYKI